MCVCVCVCVYVYIYHSLTCLYFFYLLTFFKNECHAKAVLVQCLPSKVRKMAKAIWHTKMGEKCKHKQSCQTLSEAQPNAGSERPQQQKMSQNVLSWVRQQDSRDTHVNNHQSQQVKNFLKFSLCCVRKTFHTRWKYFLVDFWLQNLSSSSKSIIHFRAEIKTGCRGYFSPPYQLLVGYLETH